MIDRTFSTELKLWHRRLGLTRNQAAAALGVPRSTYDGWCNGRRCGREPAIRRLMKFLDMEMVARQTETI